MTKQQFLSFEKHFLPALSLMIASTSALGCVIVLSSGSKLDPNTVDMPNAMRVDVAKNYLVAREWTKEGALPAIYAGAYETEHNPTLLARRRGQAARDYLIQLGLPNEDITVDKRIIRIKNGIPQNEEGNQIIIEFVPKCPASGCGDLCERPVDGAATRAIK